MAAHVATRPCLSSVPRRRLKSPTSSSLQKPPGSLRLTGACTPSSLPKALAGSHTCGPVVPKAPPWNIMLMIATLPGRLLASPGFRERERFAGSSTPLPVMPRQPRP
eukprot:10258986-Heterocapsa_arctica.AAC.1